MGEYLLEENLNFAVHILVLVPLLLFLSLPLFLFSFPSSFLHGFSPFKWGWKNFIERLSFVNFAAVSNSFKLVLSCSDTFTFLTVPNGFALFSRPIIPLGLVLQLLAIAVFVSFSFTLLRFFGRFYVWLPPNLSFHFASLFELSFFPFLILSIPFTKSAKVRFIDSRFKIINCCHFSLPLIRHVFKFFLAFCWPTL